VTVDWARRGRHSIELLTKSRSITCRKTWTRAVLSRPTLNDAGGSATGLRECQACTAVDGAFLGMLDELGYKLLREDRETVHHVDKRDRTPTSTTPASMYLRRKRRDHHGCYRLTPVMAGQPPARLHCLQRSAWRLMVCRYSRTRQHFSKRAYASADTCGGHSIRRLDHWHANVGRT